MIDLWSYISGAVTLATLMLVQNWLERRRERRRVRPPVVCEDYLKREMVSDRDGLRATRVFYFDPPLTPDKAKWIPRKGDPHPTCDLIAWKPHIKRDPTRQFLTATVRYYRREKFDWLDRRS